MALIAPLRSQPLHLGHSPLRQRAARLRRIASWPSSAREARLDMRSRVLDLGCGPGITDAAAVALRGTTIGMDADRGHDRRRAQRRGGRRPRYRLARRHLVRSAMHRWHRLNLVTIARAFHWMDREATLARLDQVDRARRRRGTGQHRPARPRRPALARSHSKSCAARTGASMSSITGARAKRGRSTRACCCAARSATSSASRCSRRARRPGGDRGAGAVVLGQLASGARRRRPHRLRSRRARSACWRSSPDGKCFPRSSRASPSSRDGRL